MRILHIIQRYYPYIGGSEQYFGELSEQFAAEGNQVAVLTTDAWDLDHFWAAGRRRIETPEEVHGGVTIMRFPIRRAPGPWVVYPALRRLMVELGRFPGSLPLVRRIARITPRVPDLDRYLLTAEPFDIVASCNITLDFTIVAAINFARRRDIPHVCIPFIHLGEPGSQHILRYYGQPYQIDLLRQSASVVVQTRREGQFLIDAGLPPGKITEIGGWVRAETLVGGDGARFRQHYGITEPIVLSIGTAAYDKGTMHTIAAMERLWAAGSEARLVLIASNTMALFEQYWARLPTATRARITLIKAAPHATKLDALTAADLFVLPSRTDSFGIVFLEAWCHGLPVIGARAGGVPDVIDDGRTGLLVDFGAVEQLAAAMTTLLTDRALARKLGTAGHAHVLEALTFERKFAQVDRLYRALVAGSRP